MAFESDLQINAKMYIYIHICNDCLRDCLCDISISTIIVIDLFWILFSMYNIEKKFNNTKTNKLYAIHF